MTGVEPVPLTGPATLERARLTVRAGPLARGLAARFVAGLGADTKLAIDRVDEACLITEAVADRFADLHPDGELRLAVAVHEDRLEIRFGPLPPPTVKQLLEADARGAGGGAIRGLATLVEIRSPRSGGEVLRVVVGAHA